MKVKWEKRKNTKQIYTSGLGTVEKNDSEPRYRWYATTAITHKRVGPFSTSEEAKKFLKDIHELEISFHKALEQKAHAIEFCGVWN